MLSTRVIGLRVLYEYDSPNVVAEDYYRLRLSFTKLF